MSATVNGGMVSEIVTGTELRKLREDLFLVRNIASVPANVEQVDRATMVSVLMAVDSRVTVMYRQLLGSNITSGEALFNQHMAKADISYPPEAPLEKRKDIIDYRKNMTGAEKKIAQEEKAKDAEPEVRVKRKYTRHVKPAETATAEKETKPAFVPLSKEQLEKLDNFIAEIRLSKLVVALGPAGPLIPISSRNARPLHLLQTG